MTGLIESSERVSELSCVYFSSGDLSADECSVLGGVAWCDKMNLIVRCRKVI